MCLTLERRVNTDVLQKLKNILSRLDYIVCYFLVMRFQAEKELDCVDPDLFAELYLAGRARSTFPTYDHAFRKAWIHGRMIGKT